MKTIAYYLPQFHEIPENNEWWGEGFTEWVNMKKAVPLFDNHYQPRVPLNNNYYDLSDVEVMRWQAKIAKDYGVYGFCFYHYWFDGHLLLQKPVEQFLNNKDIDIHFCICWANENWTQAWVSKKDNILISQNYGDIENWKTHFQYLLPFFKDERYIKINGKPLFVIYRPELIPNLNDFLQLWQKMAMDNGFPGLAFSYQQISFDILKNKDDSEFEYNIEYQPVYGVYDMTKDHLPLLRAIKHKLIPIFNKFGINITQIREPGLLKRDYDEIWKAILSHEPEDEKCIPGAFVDWDNTPRRGIKGWVVNGATPEKFKEYFSKQVKRAKDIYNKDFLFIFAWNEWAEGGYLEPDERYGYAYLQAIKDALLENDEFPEQ